MNAENAMQALMPETEQLAISAGGGSRAPLSMAALAAYIGGYRGPHWRIDRRPQPLRGRRSAERVKTLLRRRAVARLRMGGLSFRKIGRELGISQVAVWKLWKQTMDDMIAWSRAERQGRRLLAEAYGWMQQGDAEHFRALFQVAVRGFGVRAATRLLGRLE